MTRDRPVRAWLAVPAHRARLVASAARSDADAVFLDLEDAVPSSEKAQALEDACTAIQALDWGDKLVAVRLNAADSPNFATEVSRAGALPRLDAVILPKAEADFEVTLLAGLLEAAAGRGTPPGIDLLIETARGLARVDALAQAHPLVAGLHLGVGDLAASLGARSTEIGASPDGYVHLAGEAGTRREVPLDLFAYPMMRLLVAARAWGLQAIDGPCGNFRELEVTRAAAAKAASMGFDGKQVIHPTQIAPTRDAFVPGTADVARARDVLAALSAAEQAGQGAVTLDGRMIDAANIRMARRTLALAAVDDPS